MSPIELSPSAVEVELQLLAQITAAIAAVGYALMSEQEIEIAGRRAAVGLSDRVLLLHLFAKDHGWRAVSRLGCSIALMHGPNFPSPSALDRWRATGDLPSPATSSPPV